MRNTHEIRKYFRINSLKTRLICDICEANYPIDTNLSNLKRHFAKYHQQEYYSAMQQNEERRKQIKQINQIQRKGKTTLITQNNETSVVQVPKPVQVEDFNNDDYTTEEEIVEIIESGQALTSIQNNKRKIVSEEKFVKKQKINTISLNAKDSIIDLNIQDEISFRIVGKCTLNFN
jgi:hypothetical protein